MRTKVSTISRSHRLRGLIRSSLRYPFSLEHAINREVLMHLMRDKTPFFHIVSKG